MPVDIRGCFNACMLYNVALALKQRNVSTGHQNILGIFETSKPATNQT